MGAPELRRNCIDSKQLCWSCADRLLRAIEALQAAGAGRLSTLLLGYWPQVKPAFWSIALFRWDINIRESAVLGLVGAGAVVVAVRGPVVCLLRAHRGFQSPPEAAARLAQASTGTGSRAVLEAP